MLFWLKKVIGYWLMPLPLSIALILGGAILWRFTSFKRIARGCMFSGVLWLLVCSNVGVGSWMVRGLENQFPAQPAPDALARCEFIVVLGGGHTSAPAWSANNQLSASALSRIVEGVRLAHLHPSARLVVSGPANRADEHPTHARLYADVAVSLGIARERIIEISDARDTEEEAARIHSISGSAPVALVTSAWHLPRAMTLCREQSIDALPCPADFAGRPPELRFRDFFAWNLAGLDRSTKGIYEFWGAKWSRLRGKA